MDTSPLTKEEEIILHELAVDRQGNLRQDGIGLWSYSPIEYFFESEIIRLRFTVWRLTEGLINAPEPLDDPDDDLWIIIKDYLLTHKEKPKELTILYKKR